MTDTMRIRKQSKGRIDQAKWRKEGAAKEMESENYVGNESEWERKSESWRAKREVKIGTRRRNLPILRNRQKKIIEGSTCANEMELIRAYGKARRGIKPSHT